MADCNIRNIDAQLMHDLKVRAAEYKLSIRACVSEAIAMWLGTQIRLDRIDGKVPPNTVFKEPSRPEHAESCKCFICKPPKER